MAKYVLKFNYTSQFVDFLKTVPGYRNFLKLQRSSWNVMNDVTFAMTLTARGFGYTFNMIAEEKMLKAEG
jgi:hypothetical protein